VELGGGSVADPHQLVALGSRVVALRQRRVTGLHQPVALGCQRSRARLSLGQLLAQLLALGPNLGQRLLDLLQLSAARPEQAHGGEATCERRPASPGPTRLRPLEASAPSGLLLHDRFGYEWTGPSCIGGAVA
jgi:hypothetical protein